MGSEGFLAKYGIDGMRNIVLATTSSISGKTLPFRLGTFSGRKKGLAPFQNGGLGFGALSAHFEWAEKQK